ESSSILVGCKSTTSDADNGSKKQELPRNPRYTDKRMNEVYPVRKSRFRMEYGKESSKDSSLTEKPDSLQHLSALSDLAAKKRKQISSLENSVASADISQDGVLPARPTNEKCSQNKFRSVAELSLGGEGSCLATVDMDKALKGLVALEMTSGIPADLSEKSGDPSSSGNFCSEFHLPGKKAPLDFTLKTYMRLVFSSSVNWFHKSIMSSTYNGMLEFTSKSGCSEDQDVRNNSQQLSTSQVLKCSCTRCAKNQSPDKREDMCTSHFVVMFTAGCGSGRIKRTCNAYISQSTRSLRSLLKEHDVCFSMPLCNAKVEQATTEDLVELSEIEKHNLGQTRRLSSFSDIDNTPESLLALSGNANVHSLFDFLLNYRSSLSFMTTGDVPVLYSPVPFQNAAVSSPKVKCIQMKGTENVPAPSIGFPSKDEMVQDSSGLCHIIEIKDAYLPPWIINRVCAIMGAEERSFEVSFTTERTSIGLNVALRAVCEKPETEALVDEGLREITETFGIPESIVTPYLCSGQLKGLKYCQDSYTVSLSAA
ncbi:uncharacterized protein LOC110806390, partial [Carica papaya]|uniref:uncharacterized protein LOC110806390 n=1 Tax=Carica papaya TaxID=3649 RepID=UPI000B8C88B8